MSMRGWHTSGNSLRSFLTLAALCGTIYYLYSRLKNQSSSMSKINKDYALKVYNLLVQSGLNPDIAQYATAQSANETAGFTSELLKENNNLYGMKYAGQSSSSGEKNGYANYDKIQLSVVDLVIWLNRHGLNNTVIESLDDYVAFIKSNDYFEADEFAYLTNCQYYYDLIFNE
jgi:hypothetical protein